MSLAPFLGIFGLCLGAFILIALVRAANDVRQLRDKTDETNRLLGQLIHKD